MKRFQAAPASEDRYGLAEGPFWDGDRNRVLWIDINAGAVHTGTIAGQRVVHESVLRLPGTVGAVVSSRKGELLVAGARRLHAVSVDGAVTPGPRVIPETTASRLNDGACDRAGRFLVGTLALDDRVSQEVLVRINDDGGIDVIDHDLGLSNGLAFTPDGRRLYSIDTKPGIVWVRDYNPDSGVIGRRDQFLHLEGAHPDGMCLDEEGNLWIAMWDEGQVRCYSQTGKLRAVVDVAAPNTSSVAFVGSALETLMITTASEQLTDVQRAVAPDSGRLFTVDVGVRGMRVASWAGTALSAER